MDGDIPLTLRDRRRFREALAGPFRTLAQAASALDEIDFPLFERSNLPATGTPAELWDAIFGRLDSGVAPEGYASC